MAPLVIPGLGKLGQEDHKFEGSRGFIMRFYLSKKKEGTHEQTKEKKKSIRIQ